MTQNDVLIFDYNDGTCNKNKNTEFHHTEGFMHHKSSPISLQVVKTHQEITNKPSSFKH